MVHCFQYQAYINESQASNKDVSHLQDSEMMAQVSVEISGVSKMTNEVVSVRDKEWQK